MKPDVKNKAASKALFWHLHTKYMFELTTIDLSPPAVCSVENNIAW